MKFTDALKAMKEGKKVKLPSWGGYWCWDAEKETVVIHCKPEDSDRDDGGILDIRETLRVEYTLMNVASDEWMIADEENCPLLGGETTFGFDTALKYIKRGMKLARKGWNGKGIYVYLKERITCNCDGALGSFLCIDTYGLKTDNPDAPKTVVPWAPSQTDMLAEDWIFFNE